MAGSFYELTMRDSSNETAPASFHIGDITALSIAGALTQMGALRTAIENVTLGVAAQSAFGDRDIITTDWPTDPEAQRGKKWSVLFRDNVTMIKGTNKIPTADLSLLPLAPDGTVSEDLDITDGPGLALKTAIEALCKSNIGNAITVLRVYYKD